jgi:hypothetical protein
MRRGILLFPALVTALLLATGAALLTPAGAQTTSSNTAPVATIEAPTSTTTWAVGDVINFSGHATDEEDGELQASNLSWELSMQHCANLSCTSSHWHLSEATYEGIASGQHKAQDFHDPMPEGPVLMEFKLTATDSEGNTGTDSVLLDDRTVELSFLSEPSGLELDAGEEVQATPFERTAIVGSRFTISAPSSQILAGVGYEFVSWSDGGVGSHEITVGEQPSTYTANYQQPDTSAPEAPVIGSPSDGTVTSDNTPEFSGTAEAGSTVELFESSTSLGTATADSSGGWSFTPTSALNEGTHSITAKATDQAGNQSAASAELLVTVDTSAPTLDTDNSDGTDGITPDRGQTGVSRTIAPTATFSDKMDPVSLTTSIKLYRWNALRSVWQRVPATVSVAGKKATLDPYGATEGTTEQPLAANTKHKVSVSMGATNLAGLSMATPKSWTFTTR